MFGTNVQRKLHNEKDPLQLPLQKGRVQSIRTPLL